MPSAIFLEVASTPPLEEGTTSCSWHFSIESACAVFNPNIVDKPRCANPRGGGNQNGSIDSCHRLQVVGINNLEIFDADSKIFVEQSHRGFSNLCRIVVPAANQPRRFL